MALYRQIPRGTKKFKNIVSIPLGIQYGGYGSSSYVSGSDSYNLQVIIEEIDEQNTNVYLNDGLNTITKSYTLNNVEYPSHGSTNNIVAQYTFTKDYAAYTSPNRVQVRIDFDLNGEIRSRYNTILTTKYGWGYIRFTFDYSTHTIVSGADNYEWKKGDSSQHSGTNNITVSDTGDSQSASVVLYVSGRNGYRVFMDSRESNIQVSYSPL